jgi:hypothetical protein
MIITCEHHMTITDWRLLGPLCVQQASNKTHELPANNRKRP